jgi:hypothetical protein
VRKQARSLRYGRLEACATRKDDPGGVDLKVAKTQLDLLDGLIRLTKVQTAYYVKLGQVYDLVRFHDLFIKELKRRDPELAIQIIDELLNA